MRINLTSVLVDDQARALKFYTDVLGFVKKQDVPLGEYRWLTVVSREGSADVQLLLEPMAFEPARTYQKRCSTPGSRALRSESTTARPSTIACGPRGWCFAGRRGRRDRRSWSVWRTPAAT